MEAKEKYKKSGRQRTPAYAVEVEYGITEDAGDRLLEVNDSLSDIPEVRGIPTEAERREKVVKILAEAVYGYLKRKGLLADNGAQRAQNDGPKGHRPGGEGSP
jgi:hypothetical protein